MVAHVLRRQSRPWARIVRDFGIFKRPSVIIAVGSAIFLGISVITIESLNPEYQPIRGLLEQVTEFVDPPENP
jgi:hypothetical protein